MYYGIVFDAVLIVFLVFKLILGIKKGMVRSLLSLFGTVVVLIISNLLSGIFSNVIYDNIISKKITSSITNQMASGNKEVVESLQNAINGLPKFLQNALNGASISTTNINNNMNPSAVADAVSASIRPLVVGALQVLIFIILFFALRILFSFLSRFFKKINKVPLIGSLNKFLGGFLGIAQGLILAYIICMVIKVFILFNTGAREAIFTPENINSTILFKYFYNFNLASFLIHK